MFGKRLQPLLAELLRAVFRIRVRGLEHVEACRGRGAVIIANHQSFLDPLLIAAILPEKPVFAMNVHQARKWYLRPLVRMADVCVMDPAHPMSMKSLIQHLRQGRKAVVFPEGRITTSGGMMKIYEGAGLIADRTAVLLLPLRVEGAQFSRLSRLQGKMRLRWFPRITLTFLPPQPLHLPPQLTGKRRRAMAALRIYDLMAEAAFLAAPWRMSLPDALIEAGRVHGWRRPVITDSAHAELSYGKIVLRAAALGHALLGVAGKSRKIGVLLPTSPAAVVTFFALHFMARVPAMLNVTAGEHNLRHACQIAGIDTIITSRAFVERGKLESLSSALGKEHTLVYLEDLRQRITLADKVVAFLHTLAWRCCGAPVLPGIRPEDPAAILFTSGSEGKPKGVELSHANILANIHQAAACIGFTEGDVMFNALPIFHSFGLTVGTLLPLMLGMRAYLYPSPLHYRVIPEAVYDSGATVLLGTDTFFAGYARYADAYDFHTVRLAVAGAEKLKARTRQLYADRFGVRIYEGYGVTETSPILSCNTPTHAKAGTVGRLFPGIRHRLEPVEGIAQGGRLHVAGPNVMSGYLGQPPQGEWYDTGDIVEIDVEGYITICGRAKRFAKVGGEMVSLAAVEECAAVLWPEALHIALAVADERKGEQILLLTEHCAATREAFIAHVHTAGLPELMIPRQLRHVPDIPKLGSGKVDYVKAREMALTLL